VSVAERRAGLSELMKLSGPAAAVSRVDDRSVQGAQGAIRIRAYTPLEAPEELSPGLLYFHGGGLIAGTIDTHDSIARALAQAGACRVVSVDYRLAPENPFPASLDDALAVVEHVRGRAADFGIDAARLGICGDSAGGTLAAVTCQTMARAGVPPLALQLLLCPILDYGRRGGSRLQFGSGYLVDQATLEHDLRHYAPAGMNPDDPRISPLRAADLSGLPRTIIHTAEFDPLRDEGEDYFNRLTPTGAAVSYTCHAGMIHLFYGLGAVIPYARVAFEQIGAQLRAELH